MLEKVYEVCFCYELEKMGFGYQRQISIPINYEEMVFDEGLHVDVLVENQIICELKSVEEVHPIYLAQVISHLKLTEMRLGFLINFNVVNIGEGIKRVDN